MLIVTFAIGAFMLCEFAGLALDVAYLQMWKRKAQTAADAAAQAARAAAIELKRTQSSTSANSAAYADAAANGFIHNVDSVVTVENPPQSGHRPVSEPTGKGADPTQAIPSPCSSR